MDGYKSANPHVDETIVGKFWTLNLILCATKLRFNMTPLKACKL